MSETSKRHSELIREALNDARDWLSDEWATNPFVARDMERMTDALNALTSLEEQLEAARFALDGSHARGYREGVREEQKRSKEQFGTAVRLLDECLWDDRAWEPEELVDHMEKVRIALTGNLDPPASIPASSPLADHPPAPEDVERAGELARERGWKDRGGKGVVSDPASKPPSVESLLDADDIAILREERHS